MMVHCYVNGDFPWQRSSMKNKSDNISFSSQDIFHPYSCKRKYIFFVASCVIFFSTYTIVLSNADTWIDDFDEGDLKGWVRVVKGMPFFVRWRTTIDIPGWLPVGEGHLSGRIHRPDGEHLTAADFLHWNAHQFQQEKLTVVCEDINYVLHKREVSGELGLFLGKRLPEPNFAEGYIFSPEKTTKMRFSDKGVFKKGGVRADYALMFRLTSGNLRVVFDTGKFQLFTQDLLITEFFDAEMTKIDVIGMMVVFEFPGDWFNGTISTISISASGIPENNILDKQVREVQLREMQLTTTWGKLKRF